MLHRCYRRWNAGNPNWASLQVYLVLARCSVWLAHARPQPTCCRSFMVARVPLTETSITNPMNICLPRTTGTMQTFNAIGYHDAINGELHLSAVSCQCGLTSSETKKFDRGAQKPRVFVPRVLVGSWAVIATMPCTTEPCRAQATSLVKREISSMCNWLNQQLPDLGPAGADTARLHSSQDLPSSTPTTPLS